jgi:toxin YoeB
VKLVFSSDAWDDYQYWLKEDLKLFARLNDLIEETRRNPFKGTGKPEPLKHEFKGY